MPAKRRIEKNTNKKNIIDIGINLIRQAVLLFKKKTKQTPEFKCRSIQIIKMNFRITQNIHIPNTVS